MKMFLTVAVCFLSLSVIVSVYADESLVGKAFSDPADMTPMPDEWINKPIQYDTWAKGADLAIILDQHLYLPLLPIIEKYGKEKQLKIIVKEGACGISAGMITRKEVDMAGYCCPPGKEDRLPGIRFYTIGLVPLAILTHKSNPVENVTLKEAMDIFQGKLYKWNELTSQNAPDTLIKAIGRLHCPTRPGHWRLLLDNENLFSSRLIEVGSIQDMLLQIAADKGAIGYEVIANLHRYQKIIELKYVTINGYSPNNSKNLINKKYPFYETFVLSTWQGDKVKNPKSDQLARYILEQGIHEVDPAFGILPATELKNKGWVFKDDEVIGEPK
jgi:hypothetical protein